ncbi:DNA cytosine methyltransferase [Salibacterium qingdaonense]|uniref:DNA (cytosine-5-)-methyltransferase n=1 Tax=Salibacterium qingdaonense TaxID=266892 RepID=A0A1I4LJD3_9BACI|nr:DNA cytosine methyltransferase [Salibacterium qingdaonense]SFL91072.1 DNA (cytosine-5)-methyltransferase 1 [Salibacterium qingdaonense]
MPENFSNTSSRNNYSRKLPKIVDLFSGCGGFSYGFKMAGYDVTGGLDNDESAVNTASYNLHWKDGIDRDHFRSDVRDFDLDKLSSELPDDEPLLVLGGPPCQAYSQIGRAKLRSLGDERIHTKDQRGMLFEDFIQGVVDLNADMAVMENVLESVNYGGLNIPDLVCEILQENGYYTGWTVLNAADYGVPQIRERVFVIASKHKEITPEVLPIPNHKPIRNKITPAVKRMKGFHESRHFMEPNYPEAHLPEWVNVGDALSDLPTLYKSSRDKYQFYPLNLSFPYEKDPVNAFQQEMRKTNALKVSGHAYRKTTRDFPIFERMNSGDNYNEASKIADDLLEEQCRFLGIDPMKHEDSYKEMKKKIVPPYSRDKFQEKWKRLDPEITSHTLVAHLSTDTYSHIHPWEPRGISVREAARIQSFPDDFMFQCTMSNAFKQIGNAVPPLLSKALASSIAEWLQKEKASTL